MIIKLYLQFRSYIIFPLSHLRKFEKTEQTKFFLPSGNFSLKKYS